MKRRGQKLNFMKFCGVKKTHKSNARRGTKQIPLPNNSTAINSALPQPLPIQPLKYTQ